MNSTSLDQKSSSSFLNQYKDQIEKEMGEKSARAAGSHVPIRHERKNFAMEVTN